MTKCGENIRKRKDGRWEGRYVRTPGKGSKSRIHSVYGRSYKEAKKKPTDFRGQKMGQRN